jgi:hypothetical protein
MLTSDLLLKACGVAVILVFELMPLFWDAAAARLGLQAGIGNDTNEQRSITQPVKRTTSFLERLRDESFRSGLFMSLAQFALITLGLAGAAGRTFFKADYSHTLNLDIVTVAWLGIAAIGVILPEISEFGFGEVKVKVKRIRRGAQDIEQTLIEAANLAQNWSTSIAIYLMMMQKTSSSLPESKEQIFRKYVRDRMGEAKIFFGDRAGESVRIVLWLFSAPENVIRFAGIVIGGAVPTKTVYGVGEGMVGQAFEESSYEQRNFNEADARSIPSYENTRGDADPPYKAVFCQAVRWNNQPIGMLTIDKEGATHFSNIAADIAKGLASQCAMSLMLFTQNKSS